ncbi:hypothetical protein [Sphaerisporangium perillae]|uniref:hypothetical protein n=1 Tax=Sphaerisporangium perillae TaxID=2935860 RepID=UPI00200C4A42|nr:hypothetical protein [Sphaerisporangium perillae]
MRMSTLRVAPLVSCDAEMWRELVRRNADSGAGLEHIQVRAGPQGLDIFAFFRVATAEEADARLRRLVETTIASTPELQFWRIV